MRAGEEDRERRVLVAQACCNGTEDTSRGTARSSVFFHPVRAASVALYEVFSPRWW